MATTNTEWPSPTFPETVKNLVTKFFELIESTDPNVGDRLADEVFTKDAVVSSGIQVATGEAEIKSSRKDAWLHFTSRKHQILKVFDGDVNAPGSDFVLIAKLRLGLKNGNDLDLEFAQRIVVLGVGDPGARISLCHTWTDSAPLKKAIMGG